jgi:hypothetical protein
MSTEQNKVIARQFIQLWGNGSLDIIDKFVMEERGEEGHLGFLRQIGVIAQS